MRRAKRMMLIVAFCLAADAGAQERIYFEQTTVTTIDGKAPGPGVVSRVWYGRNRMRMEAGGTPGTAFILRLDQGRAYRVDPVEKRTFVMDTERIRARSHLNLALAGDLMGGDDEGAARTTPLSTLRKIAGYNCRGFRIRAGSTVMDIYLTTEIPVGISAFTDFLEWSGASQALAGLLAELQKLPGFPLETRARVKALDHVQETVSTVTRVSVGPIAEALFAPPLGYPQQAEEPEPEP